MTWSHAAATTRPGTPKRLGLPAGARRARRARQLMGREGLAHHGRHLRAGPGQLRLAVGLLEHACSAATSLRRTMSSQSAEVPSRNRCETRQSSPKRAIRHSWKSENPSLYEPGNAGSRPRVATPRIAGISDGREPVRHLLPCRRSRVRGPFSHSLRSLKRAFRVSRRYRDGNLSDSLASERHPAWGLWAPGIRGRPRRRLVGLNGLDRRLWRRWVRRLGTLSRASASRPPVLAPRPARRRRAPTRACGPGTRRLPRRRRRDPP